MTISDGEQCGSKLRRRKEAENGRSECSSGVSGAEQGSSVPVHMNHKYRGEGFHACKCAQSAD